MTEKKIILITIEKINSSFFQLTKISSSDIKKISEKFSYIPSGYQYNPKFRLLGINGVKVRMIQANGMFPAGLFNEVYNFIKKDLGKKVILSNDVQEHKLPLNDFFEGGIEDTIFSDFEFDGDPVILRDYQIGAVDAGFEIRNGLLELSTGAGKCLGGNTLLKIKMESSLAEKYKRLLTVIGEKNV